MLFNHKNENLPLWQYEWTQGNCAKWNKSAQKDIRFLLYVEPKSQQ